MVSIPTRLQENKVIMSKLSREEFTKLQNYCEIKKESINSVVKRTVMQEIDNPIPHMISGNNIFIYNKFKDNFNWRVFLDNGLRVDIGDDLPTEFISQLADLLKHAIDERNACIKKENKDSVPIPSKFVRKGL